MSDPTPRNRFQGPKGTRDFYPAEMARRRWIETMWREAAIRHGFEEIEGPTFEDADLYAVKSGEGILNELFQAFSGKSPEEVEHVRTTGRAPYALRPEFTPTLARMFVERANSLPSPTKWFSIPIHYRAERPQRGRLREFLQWNVDIIGGESSQESRAALDAELVACCIDLLRGLGLGPSDVSVLVGHRMALVDILSALEIHDVGRQEAAMRAVDAQERLSADEQVAFARKQGLSSQEWSAICNALDMPLDFDTESVATRTEATSVDDASATFGFGGKGIRFTDALTELQSMWRHLRDMQVVEWCKPNLGIARGLAYYTGMVFEVVAQGERAIAGGGRYDTLIETFGGPPTPAVGFGMGDVVLSLVLQDKGLMPSDEQIAERLGLRPDVFVIRAQGGLDSEMIQFVERLRAQGLHARRSYRATRNVGKLLKEASAARARYAAILGDEFERGEVVLKDLDTGEQRTVRADELANSIAPPPLSRPR